MNQYLDILMQVLKGKYDTPKFSVETTHNQIDMTFKLVDGKINIIFGPNKPIGVGKFILRIRVPINHIVIDGDTAYIHPDGLIPVIPINLADLQNIK